MDLLPMLVMQAKAHKHGAVCENRDDVHPPTSTMSQLLKPVSI